MTIPSITMQRGDTVYGLVRQELKKTNPATTAGEIALATKKVLEANNLNEDSATRLAVGTKLDFNAIASPPPLPVTAPVSVAPTPPVNPLPPTTAAAPGTSGTANGTGQQTPTSQAVRTLQTRYVPVTLPTSTASGQQTPTRYQYFPVLMAPYALRQPIGNEPEPEAPVVENTPEPEAPVAAAAAPPAPVKVALAAGESVSVVVQRELRKTNPNLTGAQLREATNKVLAANNITPQGATKLPVGFQVDITSILPAPLPPTVAADAAAPAAPVPPPPVKVALTDNVWNTVGRELRKTNPGATNNDIAVATNKVLAANNLTQESARRLPLGFNVDITSIVPPPPPPPPAPPVPKSVSVGAPQPSDAELLASQGIRLTRLDDQNVFLLPVIQPFPLAPEDPRRNIPPEPEAPFVIQVVEPPPPAPTPPIVFNIPPTPQVVTPPPNLLTPEMLNNLNILAGNGQLGIDDFARLGAPTSFSQSTQLGSLFGSGIVGSLGGQNVLAQRGLFFSKEQLEHMDAQQLQAIGMNRMS